jgi:hypothetical protein
LVWPEPVQLLAKLASPLSRKTRKTRKIRNVVDVCAGPYFLTKVQYTRCDKKNALNAAHSLHRPSSFFPHFFISFHSARNSAGIQIGFGWRNGG